MLGGFQWTGRITLETYIAQFHLWLVDDAKSRLILVHGYPLLNFVLVSVVYLFTSVILFEGTTVLSDALIPRAITASALLNRLAMVSLAWLALYGAAMALS